MLIPAGGILFELFCHPKAMFTLFCDGNDLGTVAPEIELPLPPRRRHFPTVATLIATLPTGEPEPGDEHIPVGIEQAGRVTSILESAGINCCIVQDTALCFYGAKRCFSVLSLALMLAIG